jgi:hypothetical protein
MKFPNKINAYHDTVIAKFPAILRSLKQPSLPVALLEKAKGITTEEFIGALSCLYAMGLISINEKGEIYPCSMK